MSARVHLVGGGWQSGEVFQDFLRDAGTRPRVGCVLVDEGEPGVVQGEFERYAARLVAAAPCTPVALTVPVEGRFDLAALDTIDALLVCGGLTPAYQEVFADCAADLPGLLAERAVPYAGFSAGAVVAAADAVVGGWLDRGVPVCPADSAEDLDEITVRPGLGLVPFAVEVHAAQWGTLGRQISTVGRGRVRRAVALDEDTLITYAPGEPVRVAGRGQAHLVSATDDGVRVRSYAAGQTFDAAWA
ncbi:hypothetical protein [Streptomyces sp. cg35]|uniref:hypothetical protein n=1 Tax=Streptomyces sp. cg35 TaxID=3421650 RepID=UPI003D1834F0